MLVAMVDSQKGGKKKSELTRSVCQGFLSS